MKRLIYSLLLVLLSGSAFAEENLSSYTEQDTGNYLTVTSSRATFTNLPRNGAKIYLYKNKTLDSDFDHKLFGKISSAPTSGAQVEIWAVSNIINGVQPTINGNEPSIGVVFYRHSVSLEYRVGLRETHDGSAYLDYYDITPNTIYCFIPKRRVSVGTNGTAYLDIYQSDCETLLDTLSLALHADTDFTKFYAIRSFEGGGVDVISGWAQEYNLGEESRIFGVELCNGGRKLCY